MTITDTTERYVRGNIAPEGLRNTSREFCGANTDSGYICSLRPGHGGPQHVTIEEGSNRVLAVTGRLGEPIVEQPTEQVLRERIALLEQRLVDQAAAHDEQRRERDRQIGAVAMRYAKQHDWCSVVRRALGELGIYPTVRWRVRTDVKIRSEDGEWEAVRTNVYVTVESDREQHDVYRDVDGMDADDAPAVLDAAEVYIPDGWEFYGFDASTSDVTQVDD